MLTAIVADDEKIGRHRLVRLVEETGEVELLAVCSSGREAVTQVLERQPQLLLLDVQLPDLHGFEVLSEIASRASPATLFVTAFDQYAIRSFDVHRIDYLLKPFDAPRFREAFARAKARITGHERAVHDEKVRALLRDHADAKTRQGQHPPLDRVAVKVDGGLQVVPTADVDWWETEGNYMRLHVDGRSHLIRMTAAAIEPQLDPRTFVRIHRRFIVNVDRIVEVQPWLAGDAFLLLRNGTKLRLSRTFRERLQARLAARDVGAAKSAAPRWIGASSAERTAVRVD